MQTRQELYDLLEYDSYEERDREYFSHDDRGDANRRRSPRRTRPDPQP